MRVRSKQAKFVWREREDVAMLALVGGLLLGLGAGCVLPLVSFMYVVLLATVAEVAISAARGDAGWAVFISILGLLCSSQIGYGFGLLVQMLIGTWTEAARDRLRPDEGGPSRSDLIAKD